VLFKFFLQVEDVTTEGARLVNTLPGLDLELSLLPVGDNVLLEGLFKL